MNLMVTRLLLGLLLAIFVGSTSQAQVEETMASREAFVIFVEGTVEVKPAGQEAWVPAEVGMKLHQSDETTSLGLSLGGVLARLEELPEQSECHPGPRG